MIAIIVPFLRGVARFEARQDEGREVNPCPRCLLFMCKKFDSINQRKESQEKIGSNDASDADDARFMGVKLFVTCVICVILKIFKKLLKMC